MRQAEKEDCNSIALYSPQKTTNLGVKDEYTHNVINYHVICQHMLPN